LSPAYCPPDLFLLRSRAEQRRGIRSPGLSFPSGNAIRGRFRVILADDHKDYLAVIARLLEPAFEVVKMVSDGQTLIKETAQLQPDIWTSSCLG
jgi:hypothetical protein